MGRDGAICVQISGAEMHDSKIAIEMINVLNEHAIERFVGDKGYDTKKIRDFLKQKGINAEIPNKCNRKKKFRFDKTVYKWRHRIENLFCTIKENRRLSMRCDK